LQQLEMQGGRYLVERRGKQGSVVAIEGGYDRMINRVGRFQQQRPDLGGLRPVHRFRFLAAKSRNDSL
jgi:hypothetical protein